MFFTKNESNILLYFIAFAIGMLLFNNLSRKIDAYNNGYPELRIIQTLLIFSIILAVIFVILGLIGRRIARYYSLKRLGFLLEQEEIIIFEAYPNKYIKIVPSILGLGIGFFIMPFLLFPKVIQLGFFMKVFLVLIFIWCCKSVFDYFLRILFFTDKRILGIFPFSKTQLSVNYEDITSIFYDDSFLSVRRLIVRAKDMKIDIRNFKNMDKINSLLNERINLMKG